ncbi:MAG: hypothetical protein IPK15_22385 [Verrucomicrobia bacterium]|nr:hypothetical protein [Verrucomicrobiota bacterium]
MSDATSNSAARQSPEPTGHREPVLHLGPLVSPTTDSTSTDEETLTGFISKAAHEVAEHSATPVVVPKDGGSIPAETMLGVVSYCYTKGVYASEDIERELVKEPLVQKVAHGDLPRPEDIRRFRRLNREAIQQTVEKALAFARRKVVEAWSPSNPFRNSFSAALPAESLPVDARPEDPNLAAHRDASERIDKATFIDGMSM